MLTLFAMKTIAIGFLLLVVGWAPIGSASALGPLRPVAMSHKLKSLELKPFPRAAAGHAIQDKHAVRRLSVSSKRFVSLSSPSRSPPLSDVIAGMKPAALVVAAASVVAAPDDSSWAVFSASVTPTINISTQTIVLVVNLKNTINMKKSDNESDAMSDDAFDWPGWTHASENPKLPIILIGPPGPVLSFLVGKIFANIDVMSDDVPSIPWSGFCGGPDDGPPQPAEPDAEGGIPDDDIFEKAARRSVEAAKHIGCEDGVIVKASEGGGVDNDNEEGLRNAYMCVQVFNEAGGSPIFLVQLCKIVRHAEVQIVGDEHGDADTLPSPEANDDASLSGTSNMGYTISLQWEIIFALVALCLVGGLFVMARGILKGPSASRGRPLGLFGALSRTLPKKKHRKRMVRLPRLRMMIFLALIVGASFQVDADSAESKGKDKGSTVHVSMEINANGMCSMLP